MPFFTFYGGKWRAAKHYPAPAHRMIVEPFAGSAGYSLNYPEHRVFLNDIDPIVAGTWEYLIRVSEREILGLPDILEGESVNDHAMPQEARWLIGWWLNKGSATPKLRPSSFMLHHPAGAPYWGHSIRERIASQLEAIRHWRIRCGAWDELADCTATWFIDPPYQLAGKHYRFSTIDFDHLSNWCQSRDGQTIVCEADKANWLPFTDLVSIDGTEGKQKTAKARMEVIWLNG